MKNMTHFVPAYSKVTRALIPVYFLQRFKNKYSNNSVISELNNYAATKLNSKPLTLKLENVFYFIFSNAFLLKLIAR